MPNAYIFSGLPGVGKTTLAKLLAKSIKNTVYYRIDTIEYYLKKEYSKKLTKQGYELAYFQAKENLELGNNVIIDCCNPVRESRELWNKLSNINSIKVINIEVICSNKQIHENRVQIRFKTNKNKYPSWQNVLDRDYKDWNQEVITIDSTSVDINDSFKQLINLLDIK
jgi:predicted kinase